jgi:phospholipase C
MHHWKRPLLLGVFAAAAAILAATTSAGVARSARNGDTATPIKHLVVIFQENVSFDHYFATYPKAANTDGQPFDAAPGTPAVDGLTPATSPSIPTALQHTADLTASNPNASPPIRLNSAADGPGGNGNGVLTCDQDHNYSDEQQAFDGGKMDKFVQSVGTDGNTHIPAFAGNPAAPLCDPKTVMDYYDGNVTTAFWNYAQRYAMSDNSYNTTFGPSAPGAINLVSGDTGGVDTTPAHLVNNPSVASSSSPNADLTHDGLGGFSLTSDAQPYFDDCSTRDAVALTGTNIGDELNAAGLSWGWFQGGFRPTTTFADAAAAAGSSGQPTSTFTPDEFAKLFAAGAPSFPGKNVPAHSSNQLLCDAVSAIGGVFGANAATSTAPWGYKDDYIPHHEPFQYYASTANPHHLTVPTDASGNDTLAGLHEIGTDTQSYSGTTPQFNTPNHNYDSTDFDQLVAAIGAGRLPASSLPAVTFLKAPGVGDGHAQYSDPLDEQRFVVDEINALEKTPDWSSTAVIISYDDSDGWYDHEFGGVLNPSASGADNLTNTTLGRITGTNQTSQLCGSEASTAPLANEQGRCGLGPRLPLLVISPWAKTNAVDHNLSDQSSIINFIEYNWGLAPIAGSFDQALAATDQAEHIPFDLAGLFDFGHGGGPASPTVLLDPLTGQVDLRSAQFNGQNLKDVNFSNAEAQGASFNGANMKDAFLEGIDLKSASLTGVNLSGADLSGANLAGARLAGVNTQGVTWSSTTCPDGTNSNADGGTCNGHL